LLRILAGDNSMTILRESVDLVQERRNALKKLFPNAFIEDKLDFEKMREMLGRPAEVSSERYSFYWAGKTDSIRARDKTSKLTIIPSKKDSINFEETKNIIIEGENLEVLKILQKSYAGKVKMIYIDPPYNTGKDFIYKDDFKEPLKSYLKYTGQVDEAGSKTSTLTEVSGRYHSNWLSMMYPRLFLARNLLSEAGVIFVSIDDNENFNLRLILNEIFGEENFVSTISWKTRSTGGQVQQGSLISQIEYIMIFAKDKSNLSLNKLANESNVSKEKWRDFRKAGGQCNENIGLISFILSIMI
jgi:adenine-specific DNA-methyltransferase